jgi:hypothetical protein
MATDQWFGRATCFIGYLAGTATGSLFYVAWLVISDKAPGVTVQFKLGFAIFLWLFEGMGASFVLMALPWYLAVLWHDRVHRSGLVYFPLIGAATTLVIGCATSSLSPKPLFIEDQTFLEGCRIAVQRQGICLLLTGLVFGLTFWLISERLRHTCSTEAS